MTAQLSARLPDFPWDTIAAAKARASAHPGGLCDLSVGTPVDPVPQIAIDALAAAAPNWAGYPTTWGTPALRRAILDYLEIRWGARGLSDSGVLPVIGTKELVAWLHASRLSAAASTRASTARPTWCGPAPCRPPAGRC